MIEFGNPWMLLGILLAALPVWLHLFGRKRAPVVHFSALDFILQANPRRARALQVREWLLVAMRAGALALAAFALARPMVPVPGSADGLDVGSGPQAVVIVIDDSMSMAARSAGLPLLARAQARAANLIERLPAGSRVAVIASGFPARPLVRQLSMDRGAALDALRRLQAHPRRDDAARALSLAQAVLDGAEQLNRRLVVLTDLQASGWQEAPLPDKTSGGADIALHVDRLRPDNVENTAIVEAQVAGTAEGDGQARVEVAVAHHGEKPFRNYLTVRAGDREVKSLLQLQPGETVRRSFTLPTGAQWAEATLPSDALEADNHRLVRLDTSTAVRVALVNGAPRPVPRDDEVFFAARALEAGASHAGELTVDVVPADKLSAASLADDDVIVLANVAEPSQAALAALQSAVAAGKGLLVAVGDNLPEPPTTYLQDLLPATLVGQRNLTGSDGAVRSATYLRWAPPGVAGGAMGPVARLQSTLAAAVGDALETSQVLHYALVKPDPGLAPKVVARYGDGAPALLLGSRGRGQVALLTTTLDRDWTDLPLQPGFMPLLHDLVMTLADPRARERGGPTVAGETSQLSRDERADQLEIRYESGGATPPPGRLVLAAANQRGPQWTLPGLEEPGRYIATELRAGVALGSRPVVVVPSPAESDLRSAAAGSLARAAQGHAARKTASQVATAPGWSAVLLLLLVLLLVEAASLARGARVKLR